MLKCDVLYYDVLHCYFLHCTVPHSVVLRCSLLFCGAVWYAMLHFYVVLCLGPHFCGDFCPVFGALCFPVPCYLVIDCTAFCSTLLYSTPPLVSPSPLSIPLNSTAYTPFHTPPLFSPLHHTVQYSTVLWCSVVLCFTKWWLSIVTVLETWKMG